MSAYKARGTAWESAVVRYVRANFNHDGTWRHAPSPYAGLVLAATDDATGTYVLFANSTGIHVGKRTRPSGAFENPVRLSGNGTSGAALPQGDIVALAGGYWAVWT